MFRFLGQKIQKLFKSRVDEEQLEELEALFFEADLGREISEKLTENVRQLLKKQPNLSSESVLHSIKELLLEELEALPSPPLSYGKPHVILVVGVNGGGKTTTIAKMAHRFQSEGKKVLIAAADTFRAAAIEQLEKWAIRTGSLLVKGKRGSDAASVVFDALAAAQGRAVDIVLVDTAGRLHTKTDLMKELEKIYRVCGKACPQAPHETLLVIDAVVGQNSREQADEFHKYTPLTGLILTKFDSSAKGGSVLSIQKKMRLPIKYVGTGERIEALELFDPKKFVHSLFDPSSSF